MLKKKKKSFKSMQGWVLTNTGVFSEYIKNSTLKTSKVFTLIISQTVADQLNMCLHFLLLDAHGSLHVSFKLEL